MEDIDRQPASHFKEAEAATVADSHPLPDAPAEEAGMEELLRDSDFAFRRLRRGETVEGTVVRVDDEEVLVDIGLKSEGVIPARELFTEGEEVVLPQVGDRILVYVMQPESNDGHAVLSLRRAQMERSWRDIEDLYHRGSIVEGPVVDFNKGGLIVDVKGIRGFVPVSQILDLRNVSRQEGENEEVTQTLVAMRGRRLSLKIIEINRSRNRLILSERSAVQERRTQRKDELMDQLEPGQVRRGVVSNLTNFGAFIDLGGADGLVHVSELSYNRVNHPNEILQVGQDVDVFVLSVDRDTKKIALSLKRALPDPWTTVEERYHIGEVVSAVITKLAKFGAFAKVEEGLEGLIHLSELTDLPVQDAAQVVREGQPVNVKIIHINSPRRRLGLSVRQASQPSVESFGSVDPNTLFADHDFGSDDETAADIDLYIPPTHASNEEDHLTGGQDTHAAESEFPEPEAQAEQAPDNHFNAASPAADEAPATDDDPTDSPLASTAPQGSASE